MSLRGLRVVITRPRERAGTLAEAVESAGGRVLLLPVIETGPADGEGPDLEPLDRLDQFDVAVFVSVPAVAETLARKPQGPWPNRVLAVGRATAEALAAAGIEAETPEEGADSEALLTHPWLAEPENLDIAILAAPGGRKLLAETLTDRGARVRLVPVYQRRQATLDDDSLVALRDDFDSSLLTATSTAILEALVNACDSAGLDPRGRPLAVASSRIAKRAEAMGFRQVVSATGADTAAMMAALVALADGSAGAANAVDSEPDSSEAHVMAEAEKTPTPESSDDRPNPAPARGGGALSGLALILALAAAGVAGWSGWQWYRFEPPLVDVPELPDVDGRLAALQRRVDEALAAQSNDLDARLSRIETALGSRIDRAGDQAAARVDELAAEARRDQTSLQRRLEALEAGVARLAQQGLGSEQALGLAEAEFLLQLANERLILFADPEGAAHAMTLADEQIKALGDPIYDGVRQALATEIQALESVEVADRVAISGRLLQLAAASPEWPLDARRSLRAEGANLLEPDVNEIGWWARTKAALADLVVVHRETTDATVLLTLEEERLLRENIQLQLQVAQLAAVRGEQSLYAAAIGMVRDWLLTYYDQGSVQVGEAQRVLADLEALDLSPRLPDTGEALRRLRNLRATVDAGSDAP